MYTTWEKAREMAYENNSHGGLFVLLEHPGDSVIGVFCGEPFAHEVAWTGERFENYDSLANHPQRTRLRVMLNFYVPSENSMKVIEGGTTWFREVLKMREKYGLEWQFEIKRLSAEGDPYASYSILPEKKLDDELKAKIAKCQLHDLEELSRSKEDFIPKLSDKWRAEAESLRREMPGFVAEIAAIFDATARQHGNPKEDCMPQLIAARIDAAARQLEACASEFDADEPLLPEKRRP